MRSLLSRSLRSTAPRRSRGPRASVSISVVLAAGLLVALSGAAARGQRSDQFPQALPAEAWPAAESGSGGSECAWTTGLEGSDLDDPVQALAVFDDGGGAAIYAGGQFTTAGDAVVHRIARWDGAGWSPLDGPAGTGMGGTLNSTETDVAALAVYDDGGGPALYAAGDFTSAGGVLVNGIARWGGSGWSALAGPSGTGLDGPAAALAVFDDGGGPALYAGGTFHTAGGVVVNGVAKWNGTTWSALSGPAGTGVGGNINVRSLAVYDDGGGPALYAGGGFANAGGVVVNRVAKWDGTTWSTLSGPAGTGVGNAVLGVAALAVYDDGSGPELYAGGDFATAGGVSVSHVARWDGTAWSALSGPAGTGTSNLVSALAVYDGGGEAALYAGGSFSTAGGVTASNIARWDGSAWSALTGPAGTGVFGSVLSLEVYDDGSRSALYAGGGLWSAGGVTTNYIARWDGGWTELGPASGAGMDSPGTVSAFATYDDGGGPALYAGGDFVTAGGVIVNRVARWDGENWSALIGPVGAGVDRGVHALAVFDDGTGPALYAGGLFTSAGGVTVNHIARWDGTAWSPLAGPAGTGTDFSVHALAVFDDGSGPALYAGGHFASAGGSTAFRIAKWDGSTWSPLSGPAGNGMDAAVQALAVFDDGGGPALYAGGDFVTAGGVTVNRVARWDGAAWSALTAPGGVGAQGTVLALAVYDDGGGSALFAGGFFTMIGDVLAARIAKWDGSAWSALTAPGGNGTTAPVYELGVYDDVGGPALFAGGEFLEAGGLTVDRIARWDGSAWSGLTGPAGTGLGNRVIGSFVTALAVFDDGSGPALYAGGLFNTAGGVPSRNIARWLCTPQIFADGFESGDASAWSGSAGGP